MKNKMDFFSKFTNKMLLFQSAIRIRLTRPKMMNIEYSELGFIFLIIGRTYESTFATVCERRKVTLGFYSNAQPKISLHGRVICHMNGNFVSFQNMCNLKRSDL